MSLTVVVIARNNIFFKLLNILNNFSDFIH